MNVKLSGKEKVFFLFIGQFFTYQSGLGHSEIIYTGMLNKNVFSLQVISPGVRDAKDLIYPLYFPAEIEDIKIYDGLSKPHLFKRHSVDSKKIVLEEMTKEAD